MITTGKTGNGLLFDNDYVDVVNGTGLSFGTGNFSVSLWVKPSQITSNQMFMLWYGDATAGASQWWLRAQGGGGLYFMTAGGGSEQGTGGTSGLTAGQWTHVVAKREANLLKLYVNGALYSSATVSTPFNVNGANTLRIGREKSGASRPWVGVIDEVRLYNYALSDAEVQQIYQGN